MKKKKATSDDGMLLNGHYWYMDNQGYWFVNDIKLFTDDIEIPYNPDIPNIIQDDEGYWWKITFERI